MAAAPNAADAAQAPLPISVEDLDSLLSGSAFTVHIVDAFFSVVYPALMQAEGVGQHLERCLVLAPGLLRELCLLLLGPPSSTPAQAFPNLEAWCQSHKLLGKQFLLLPLVDATHASLLIVCQLGGQPAAVAAEDNGGPAGDSGAGGRPCILHLDSLHAKGQGHRPNLGSLRAFLQRMTQQQGATLLELTEESLPAVPVSVPQQDNACDGAAYMCTNAIYFVANLPPEIDPQAVMRLRGYSSHLQDLFEGTPHCFPGFLTPNWYPKNVPASLRKRLLQGLAEMIQERQQQTGRNGPAAEHDVLLQRARAVEAQLRAVSKRPFEMPAMRKQKQAEMKAFRLRHGGGARASLLSEGASDATHAAVPASGGPALADTRMGASAGTAAAAPAAAAPAAAAGADLPGGVGSGSDGPATEEAALCSGGRQPSSSGRQRCAHSNRRPPMPAGDDGTEEAELSSGSHTEEELPETSDSDPEYLPEQHAGEHQWMPTRQRRQSGQGRESSVGRAAGAASAPRTRPAGSIERPSSVGQGAHPASSAGTAQAAQPVGDARATARGLKRMSTGDLRGRITLAGTEYYLGRYPTTLAAAQAEDFVALWKLGPAAAESKNKLNLPLGQYDSDVVAAVRACSDFPAVKALAQQRCGTSMSSLQGARVKGEPAAQGRGSAAAEPAASSAGRPAGAGSRSQAQQQGPGAGSSKRLAEGAPPGSEPPAKRQQADVAGSFAGEPHAASGSAQPAAHLQQEPPVDVKEGLAWQPQQQRLQEAVGHLAALEHAQEGQQLRKQMQAMIRVLQLLGLEPEIWADYIDVYARLPKERQQMGFAALQVLLEQLAATAPSDAGGIMTRWIEQRLSS